MYYAQPTCKNSTYIETVSTLFPVNQVVQSPGGVLKQNIELCGLNVNIPINRVPDYCCAIKIEVETSNFPLRPSLE